MKYLVLVVLVVLFASALPASEVTLERITVTARKIEEDSQVTPLSVSVFNEDQLKEMAAKRLRELTEATPNVQMVGPATSRYLTPYIRGIGNLDLNLPDDISVSVYLDEIPLPRYSFDISTFDLEQVEILRGPQGTLFGNNTQAGAISVSTRRPRPGQSQHLITGGYGNLDSFHIGGSTENSSQNSDLAHRFSVQYREQGGYIEDTVLNRDLGDYQRLTLSETLYFDPTDSFSLKARVALQTEKGNDPNIIARGTENYPVSGNDILPAYKNNLITASIRWDRHFGATTLTGVHGINYYDFTLKYDELDYYAGLPYISQFIPASMDPADFLNDPNSFFRELKEYDRSVFNEIRLSGRHRDKLSWTAGLNSNLSNYRLINLVNSLRFGFGPPSELNIKQNVKLKGNHLALFGESSYQLGERTRLTLGGRYNYDRKEFISDHTSTNLSSYNQASASTFQDITGRLILDHRIHRDHYTYASLSRGYRPGGYPAFQFNNYIEEELDQDPYGKSTSWTYEWGLKSEVANRRIRNNISLFLTELEGNQIRLRDAQTRLNRYENVDTQIYGGEWESSYQLTYDLRLGLGLGYTRTKFKEEKQISESQVIPQGGRTANVPLWNGSSYIQYAPYFEALKGTVFTRLSYHYQGSRLGENTNLTRLPSYGLWNGVLGYERSSFTLSLSVTNIFDKVYETQGFLFESIRNEVSTPGLPRLYMLSGTLSF